MDHSYILLLNWSLILFTFDTHYRSLKQTEPLFFNILFSFQLELYIIIPFEQLQTGTEPLTVDFTTHRLKGTADTPYKQDEGRNKETNSGEMA